MRDEIRRELESFGFGPSLLQATLRQLPKKMWCYQPRTDRWSIHDMVIHLADAEAGVYVRSRGFIAEPGSASPEFDSHRWRLSLGYFNQSVREALDIIFQLRKSTHRLLCTLPDHMWDSNVTHARLGSITLKRWVTIQQRHIPHHIEQMRDNYDSWIKIHPSRKPASSEQPSPQLLRESVLSEEVPRC